MKQTKTSEVKSPIINSPLRNFDVTQRFYYKQPDNLSNDLIPVRRFGKWGYTNRKGQELIPFIYTHVYPFSEGFACVKIDQKWKFINTNGEYLKGIDGEYHKFDIVRSFSEGYAAVMNWHSTQQGRKCKWTYIDKLGGFINLLRYYGMTYSFKNDLAYVSYVEQDSKSVWYQWLFHGYIDAAGNEYWNGPSLPPISSTISY